MTFEQALHLAGLRPRDVAPDGRWYRCATDDKPRKRNGAYKLLVGGGRGFFRNWALHDGIQVWDDDREREVKPVDVERLRAQRLKERAHRIQAMRSARAYWSDSSPLSRPHPYLANKGLSPLGCSGLRINDGMLVVPVRVGDWLVSVQTIHPDGTKRFWPGAPVKSGYHVIDRQAAAVTVFAEGLATGLAIFQCIRHARVVVAFDCGNLLHAAQRLRPTGAVVIAADNDHKTAARIGVNPGVEQATNAALLLGCGTAYPRNIEGSDWADALKEHGNPKRIEREILGAIKYVADTS